MYNSVVPTSNKSVKWEQAVWVAWWERAAVKVKNSPMYICSFKLRPKMQSLIRLTFKSLGVLTPKPKSWNPGLPYPHIRTLIFLPWRPLLWMCGVGYCGGRKSYYYGYSGSVTIWSPRLKTLASSCAPAGQKLALFMAQILRSPKPSAYPGG